MSRSGENGPLPLQACHVVSSPLRRILVAGDALAVSTVWLLVLAPLADDYGDAIRLFLAVESVALLAILALAGLHLYRARVCSIRAVELRGLASVSTLTAIAVFVMTSSMGFRPGSLRVVLGCLVTLSALLLSRCVYTAWLRASRMDGRHLRRVVLVGTNEEGTELERLVNRHPELGLEVAAVAQSAQQVRPLLAAHDANGVIIAVSALGQTELNLLVRELLREQVHVVVSNGLLGIDHQRLRPQPLAREPLFYLEPTRVSPTTAALKRAVDIAGASVGLLVSLPVLVVAAIVIKAQDGGPILFRQQRIGRHGRPFTLYKFRSMAPQADRDRERLQHLNQREGPIFKADNDPRVTRVGRLIRVASIDELPQLVNVLVGTMSLVGPRPATPAEVAQFDEELLARHAVRPGMTGLWQVEARDNQSFHSYRRLDLFYMENLSLRLDFLILLDTITAVLTGVIRSWMLRANAATAARTRVIEGTLLAVPTDGQLDPVSTVGELNAMT